MKTLAATSLLAFALCLSACVDAPPPKATHCRVGGDMIETQLFFGLSKPKGGVVSAREWDAFVTTEISPRFAEGFSVVDSAGFWRDGATQKTISEKSKVVVRMHPATDEADRAILAIVDAYKKRFQQEAVLRVDRVVCAQF